MKKKNLCMRMKGMGSIYTELDGQDQLLLITSNGWNSVWGATMIKVGIYTWVARLGCQEWKIFVQKKSIKAESTPVGTWEVQRQRMIREG
jgi:hypothetical protein